MGYRDQKISREFTTHKFLDKSKDPWGYVDQELPTTSVKIFARKKMGTMIDSSHGVINMGSLAFSGSYYDFYPGSTALRIIRRSIGVGSMATGGQVWWHLHHSRLGTLDSLGINRAAIASRMDNGNPLEPLYILPAGTVTVRMVSLKGSNRIASSLEGVF